MTANGLSSYQLFVKNLTFDRQSSKMSSVFVFFGKNMSDFMNKSFFDFVHFQETFEGTFFLLGFDVYCFIYYVFQNYDLLIFCISRLLIFSISRVLIFCISRLLIFCIFRLLIFCISRLLIFCIQGIWEIRWGNRAGRGWGNRPGPPPVPGL